MAIYSEFTHEKRWFSIVMWQFTRSGTLKHRKRPVKKGRSSKADDAGYLWGLLHFHRPHIFRHLTRRHVSIPWSSNDTWKKCPTLESLSYLKNHFITSNIINITSVCDTVAYIYSLHREVFQATWPSQWGVYRSLWVFLVIWDQQTGSVNCYWVKYRAISP